MAAPMREAALGADGGQRSKVAGAARSDPPNNNFEYDDNEWDIGIGDLIIDLDADIEKTDEGKAAMASAGPGATQGPAKPADHSATLDKGLKMKIKRTKPGTKTSEAKHEIVKSNELNGESQPGGGAGAAEPPAPANSTTSYTNSNSTNCGGAVGPARRVSAAHRRDKARERPRAGSPGGGGAEPPNGLPPPEPAPAPAPAAPPPATQDAPALPVPPPQPPPAVTCLPTPAKKIKTEPKVRETALLPGEERQPCRPTTSDCNDVCVGTSVGTITEPDCLGPCEPGTSVTLEGIVWHETEGGVLVVNVTWRGKTYVGTLLDCTRHDWAPPRFCDSPTEELDARTPKGRGKRGRAAASGGDLSNFTETRSSVHSKLRNGGAKGRRGAPAGGAGTAAGGAPPREAPSPPPTPRAEPVPAPAPLLPGKRKSRAPEEEAASPASKRRAPASPPASPALLECPEQGCSKKYKHINGLKYHQSHAHGAIEDEDAKDAASMSENEESNAEAPSPATPVKSPQEKPLEAPATPKEEAEQPVAPPSPTPAATPALPPAAPPVPVVPAVAPAPPAAAATDPKQTLVKPGVLRFGPQEDFPNGNFIPKSPVTTPVVVNAAAPVPVRSVDGAAAQFLPQQLPPQPPGGPPPSLPPQQPPAPLAAFTQVPHPIVQQPLPQVNAGLPQISNPPPSQLQKVLPPGSPQNPQFKVKPTAALMPADDKKLQDMRLLNKTPSSFKKNKNRKSPGGSPLPMEQQTPPAFGMEQQGREDVTSPAYSDISDDTAPVTDSEGDKSKGPIDKKMDGAPPLPHAMPPGYGMYQYFGQQPYLVPGVNQQALADHKLKDDLNKAQEKQISEKEIKREDNLPPQKMLPQQHYYPYGYMPGYSYNMDPNYGVSMVTEDKLKEQDRERSKENPSPGDHSNGKPGGLPGQPPHQMAMKPKLQDLKDPKHQNDNHQILKESIEMKSQMNPYLYRHQQAQAQAHAHHQAQQQREDDIRRYYMTHSLEQQRRKEHQELPGGNKQTQQLMGAKGAQGGPPTHPATQGKPQSKEIKQEEPSKPGSASSAKEDIKPIKQEGQKPTMETTGPPPAPTSQYYLHPSYMQQHYGGLHFDPMYRGLNPMIVSSPYAPGPYLHAGPMPRYHAPEDLSRPPPNAKGLDLLQHQATQYYQSHKIHELQERALKSPTPKSSAHSSGSPGGAGPPNQQAGQPPSAPPPGGPPPKAGGPPGPGGAPPANEQPAGGKDSRSPPPQRHVHTHHHTHVGLGYPLYPAPYGAAVLASEQAAAVINTFPPK